MCLCVCAHAKPNELAVAVYQAMIEGDFVVFKPTQPVEDEELNAIKEDLLGWWKWPIDIILAGVLNLGL